MTDSFEITVREDNASPHEAMRLLSSRLLETRQQLVIDEFGAKFLDQFWSGSQSETSATVTSKLALLL